MKLSFYYGTDKIEFNVIYRKRKTMEIRIEPPGIITVIAPLKTPEAIVIERTKTKANWILKKKKFYKENDYKKPERSYKTGETFMYLGQNYSLEVKLDLSNKKAKVYLEPEKICVMASSEEGEFIKVALVKWYKERAMEKVNERVLYFQKYFFNTPRSVRVKEQKKRWGTCTGRDDLLFNWRIIMAAPEALDYVVIHEMCHMMEKNHSKQYWKLVSSIMPDYKERKALLEKLELYFC